MVFFKMNFVRKDSAGVLRDGLAVTNQHTYWNHAEKDLVRICRAVPGYVMHGETVVTKPGAYEVKIGESRDAYVEYIDDDGALFGALTAPVASSSPQAINNEAVESRESLVESSELTQAATEARERGDGIKKDAQVATETQNLNNEVLTSASQDHEDEEGPLTEDMPAPVSDTVYRGVKPFRM